MKLLLKFIIFFFFRLTDNFYNKIERKKKSNKCMKLVFLRCKEIHGWLTHKWGSRKSSTSYKTVSVPEWEDFKLGDKSSGSCNRARDEKTKTLNIFCSFFLFLATFFPVHLMPLSQLEEPASSILKCKRANSQSIIVIAAGD